MKPFNLERALAGDPVVTRDGRKVEKVVHLPDVAYEGSRVVAVFTGILQLYAEDGRVWKNLDSEHDLFLAPKQTTVWVNIYKNGTRPNCDRDSYAYNDEEVARRNGMTGLCCGYLGTYPITIEE